MFNLEFRSVVVGFMEYLRMINILPVVDVTPLNDLSLEKLIKIRLMS